MVLMVALDEDDWLLVRIVYFFLSSIAIIALVSNSLLLYTSIVTKSAISATPIPKFIFSQKSEVDVQHSHWLLCVVRHVP